MSLKYEPSPEPQVAEVVVPQGHADHGKLCKHVCLRFGLALEPSAYI